MRALSHRPDRSRVDLPVVVGGGLFSGALALALAVLFGSWAPAEGSDAGPTEGAADVFYSVLLLALLLAPVVSIGAVMGAGVRDGFGFRGSRHRRAG